MRGLLLCAGAVSFLTGTSAAARSETSPTVGAEAARGRWQTIDDRTGRPRALVTVRIENGELKGHIERIYSRPDEDPDPVCGACKGWRHGRKVVGMEILWGFHVRGDRWVGGRVLDPENGKEYRGKVWLEDSDTLKLRGYWGPFHRTQTWRRLKPTSDPGLAMRKDAPGSGGEQP